MLASANRLTRPRQFSAVVRRGVRAGRSTVVVHLLSEPCDAIASQSRVGFVVSKAVGNAVVRNRVKRRLRAIMRGLIDQTVPADSWAVVRALPAAATASFMELSVDVEAALSRALRVGSARSGTGSGSAPFGSARSIARPA